MKTSDFPTRYRFRGAKNAGGCAPETGLILGSLEASGAVPDGLSGTHVMRTFVGQEAHGYIRPPKSCEFHQCECPIRLSSAPGQSTRIHLVLLYSARMTHQTIPGVRRVSSLSFALAHDVPTTGEGGSG